MERVSTTEELEVAREARITENTADNERGWILVEKRMDFLVELIHVNRGHVGGIAFVLLPLDGDALVDPEERGDNIASDGIAAVSAIGQNQTILLCNRIQELIDDIKPNKDPLAKLISRFKLT